MREPDDPTGSTDAAGGAGVYARWSRRKALARSAAGARSRPQAGQPSGEAAAEPPGGLPGEPGGEPPATLSGETLQQPPGPPRAAPLRELTDEDMPPLESLGENADYSGFMSPGVSEELRNRALRKLFMSSAFNVVDGLDDYDDDFTRFEGLGDLITADMRHRLEQEARKTADAVQEEARSTLPPEPDAPPLLDDASAGAARQQPADGQTAQASAEHGEPVAGDADAQPQPGPEPGPGRLPGAGA